jgi:hypothetical protein
MKTYVVFDRKTGEILKTHVQTAEHAEPSEHFLKTMPDAERSAVDVLAVPEITAGSSYRVDVKARKLIPLVLEKAKGAGGGFVQPAGGDPRLARRIFFDRRAQKKY